MSKVRCFDDIDEMFEVVAEEADEARRNFEAMRVRFGKMFDRMVPGRHYVNICGWAVVFGEIVADEFEELVGQPDVRFVRGWSVACPAGEMGIGYVVDMLPITDEYFECARQRGWDFVDFEIARDFSKAVPVEFQSLYME